MAQAKPLFLNLGCGKVILPAHRPQHHWVIPEDIYTECEWVNVDHSPDVGANQVFDLFKYPWPLPSATYEGALLSHIAEHIPHTINADDSERGRYLASLPDGFYAFFAELYRVTKPNAPIHVIYPYALSTGAFQDPTHHRYIVPETFSYLTPNPNAPFVMNYGSEFASREVTLMLSPHGQSFARPGDAAEEWLNRVNAVSDVYQLLQRGE